MMNHYRNRKQDICSRPVNYGLLVLLLLLIHISVYSLMHITGLTGSDPIYASAGTVQESDYGSKTNQKAYGSAANAGQAYTSTAAGSSAGNLSLTIRTSGNSKTSTARISGSSAASNSRKTGSRSGDVRTSESWYSGAGWIDIAKAGDNFYFCAFEGTKHNYIVDLPKKTQGAPVILMLHGSGGDAERFRYLTGLYKEAVSQGYIVIHATAGPNPSYGKPSNRWNHDEYGGKNDVGFLTALVSKIINQYHADSSCCFAVGYSNGAYMAHRLAIDASDVFSAVVSVEGAMAERVWDRRPAKFRCGVFQITGTKDVVVPQYSYKRPRDKNLPPIEDVMEYYAIANDLYGEIQKTVGNGCILSEYRGNHSGNPVWHLVIPNGVHHWSADAQTGVNTNHMVLMYLSKCRHR